MTRSVAERKKGHPDHWGSGPKPGHSVALQSAGKEARQSSETTVRSDMEPKTRQRMVSRLLRFGVSGTARSSAEDPTAMGELETELALLREENAWLKVERQRPADAGRIVERMRELDTASRQPRE